MTVCCVYCSHNLFLPLSNRHLCPRVSSDRDGWQNYDVWGCCVTEVEVDILTGEQFVRRVDMIEDAGKPMSPQVNASGSPPRGGRGGEDWRRSFFCSCCPSRQLISTRSKYMLLCFCAGIPWHLKFLRLMLPHFFVPPLMKVIAYNMKRFVVF